MVLLVTGGGKPRGKGVRKFCLAQTLRDVGLNQGSGGEGQRQRQIQGKSGRGLVATPGTSMWGESRAGGGNRRFCLGGLGAGLWYELHWGR